MEISIIESKYILTNIIFEKNYSQMINLFDHLPVSENLVRAKARPIGTDGSSLLEVTLGTREGPATAGAGT